MEYVSSLYIITGKKKEKIVLFNPKIHELMEELSKKYGHKSKEGSVLKFPQSYNHIYVYVNGKFLKYSEAPETTLMNEDKVTLIPAIVGGC